MHIRVVLALVLFCDLAVASTFHVSPTGSDAADGSAATPWRTLQRAADVAAAGDVVEIAGGTYAGFRIRSQGTAAAPIVFRGVGDARVVGNAAGVNDAIWMQDAAWIRIEALTVTGATRAGVAILDSHDVTVRGSVVDANGRWGVFSSFTDDLVVEDNQLSRSATEHGVYASNSADRPRIRNNRIFGNGMCGVHMNGDINFGGDGVISGAIVEGNVISDNGDRGGSGINGDGIMGALILNNVLDGNHASGISLYRIDGGAASTGNQVVHNTIRMASDARGGINIQDGSTGNVVRNNVVANLAAGRGAFEVCGGCISGMVSEHNAIVGRMEIDGTSYDLAGWRIRTGKDATSFVATEAQLFADATAGDLSHRAGSPAIDVADPALAPETDVEGVARPQGAGVDLGAYEYCDGPCTEPGDGGDDGDGAGDAGDDGDGGGSGSGGGDGGGDGDGYRAGEPAAISDGGGCSTGSGRARLLAGVIVASLRRRRRRPGRALRSGTGIDD